MIAGKAEPGFRSLAGLAAATDVSLDWLATGKGPMRPVPKLEIPPPLHGRPGLSEPAPAPVASPQKVVFDANLMQDVIVAVDEALAEKGVKLPAGKRADIYVGT